MVATIEKAVLYNVVCANCGSSWQPELGTPLWWTAKQDAKKHPNRLDAMCISGERCGCIKKQHHPDALFRVFGYDSMCQDFDIACHTFVQAVKIFRDAVKHGDTVFIDGVSDAVSDKLQYGS